MKPEDLKSPFKWDQRRVLIQDRIFYVPTYYDKYDEFQFPGWKSEDLFGNDKPISIEYCSGNGAWIASKAIEEPCRNWVAVEKRFDRSRKIWSKIKNHKLDNLIVICGEGLTVSKYYLPSQSIEHIYINFPDPWPKQRHAKHRIMQPIFVDQMERLLLSKGRFTFVTDDHNYSQLAISEMKSMLGFQSAYPDPFYVTAREGYGTSFFEELWREKGKKIRYHEYVKAS